MINLGPRHCMYSFRALPSQVRAFPLKRATVGRGAAGSLPGKLQAALPSCAERSRASVQEERKVCSPRMGTHAADRQLRLT